MEKLRLGIIGVGHRSYIAPLWNQEDGRSVITAVAEINEENIQRFKDNVTTEAFFTNDYHELLEREDVDAVVILTEDFKHKKHAIDALKAGKDVFLEKPMAITIEDCDEIIEVWKVSGRKLMIGFNMRYMPMYNTMKEVIDSGHIGDVKAIWVRHFVGRGGVYYYQDWHRNSNAGIISEKNEIMHMNILSSNTKNREDMYESVKAAIDKVIKDSSIDFSEIEGIGVGIPGLVHSKEGIAVYQANIPWENFPVVSRLKEDYPFKKVLIDNDVRMAAFAEWQQVKKSEKELFVYITISTGIAGAFIENGTFVKGAGFSGELGQVPVNAPFNNRKVRLEQAVAGPAIEKIGRERLGNESITTKEVFEGYEADPICQEIIDECATILAEQIYSVVALVDPHSIVFGGSVITNNHFYLSLIKEKLEKWLLPDQKHILESMTISKYEHLSGLVGAGLSVFY